MITLIEILIAVALSGVLLTILVQILIPGLQIWRQTSAVSEIEQNAMVAIAKIELALLNTTADSITVINRADRQAVSCLDNEGTLTNPGYAGTTPEIFWRSMAIFEVNPAEGVLRQYRHELPPRLHVYVIVLRLPSTIITKTSFGYESFHQNVIWIRILSDSPGSKMKFTKRNSQF